MSLDQEAIAQWLDLLAVHRRTLAVYLRQQAELGVLATPGIVNGIAETQGAIRRIKEQLRADGVPVEDEPNDDIQPAVAPPSRLTPQELRNRRAMLTKVKTIWIEGLLEQALAKELRIAFDLTEQPNAVDLPLNALVQELNRPPRTLPTDTPIIKVFDQMGGALLILGAPGAGKTTLLLELARDLIARAEQDEGHPIPAVFNLSSWAEKRRPLKEWLIEELNRLYYAPPRLAQAWMGTNAILPLLDGLDEVDTEIQAVCVKTINEYHQSVGGLSAIAICSRIGDYQALKERLKLQGAVLIEPLSQWQIESYFTRVGGPLRSLREQLDKEPLLMELLDTPLMLNVFAQVYNDTLVKLLNSGVSAYEQRRYLWRMYINRMLVRRRKETRYSQRLTIQWLSWLAARMVKKKLVVYYTDNLQPSWLLDKPHEPWLYVGGGMWAAGLPGMNVDSVPQITLPQPYWRKYTLQVRLMSMLLGALLGVLALSLVATVLGLVIALAGDFNVGISGELLGASILISLGALLGAIAGLVEGWRVGKSSSTPLKAVGLIIGCLIGLLLGLPFKDGLAGFIGGGLVGFWVCGWVGSVIGSSGGGSVNNIPTLEALRWSGKALVLLLLSRVGRSFARSLLSSIIVGLILGIIFLSFFFNTLAPSFWLVSLCLSCILGVYFSLMHSITVGMEDVGNSIIQHYTLRWMLYRNGSLPLRLVPFLDYCVDRIFLRRVGGGYIFVHRLLMEHFASLYTQQPEERA